MATYDNMNQDLFGASVVPPKKIQVPLMAPATPPPQNIGGLSPVPPPTAQTADKRISQALANSGGKLTPERLQALSTIANDQTEYLRSLNRMPEMPSQREQDMANITLAKGPNAMRGGVMLDPMGNPLPADSQEAARLSFMGYAPKDAAELMHGRASILGGQAGMLNAETGQAELPSKIAERENQAKYQQGVLGMQGRELGLKGAGLVEEKRWHDIQAASGGGAGKDNSKLIEMSLAAANKAATNTMGEYNADIAQQVFDNNMQLLGLSQKAAEPTKKRDPLNLRSILESK